jgi:hypothetical protein
MEAYAMNIITQDVHQKNVLSQKMQKFFSTYHIGQILRQANACKLTGVPAIKIVLFVFVMTFSGNSMYMKMKLHPEDASFGKDTFYRFMKSCHTNWRKFTSLLCYRIIKQTIEPLTGEDRLNVLIIDDSIYSRARSKKVELLAKVFDHARHIYTYGFRMLTLCWSDGNTVLPVSHCLLSTENARNRIQEASAKVDARSNGNKQRKLAQMKATEVALELLKEAKAMGIPAKHVLFDSWFCTPSAMLDIKEIGYYVIGMVKKSSKIHFCFNGKMQDVKSIYSQSKKRRGKAAWKLSVEVKAVKDGRETPVRLVYVLNRNKKREYLVLATTDMSLTEDEIIRNYGKRWGIEVFFKVCKSYLKLSKESRSLSYDAMTAHVAIVFTRYMMLAVEQRESVDERSLGELFFISIEELSDVTLTTAVELIILEFVKQIERADVMDSDKLAAMVEKFIASLPSLIKQVNSVCQSEMLVAA